MSIASEVAVHLPYLRRYARALTGSQVAGDAVVKATLEDALADAAIAASLKGGRIPLYRAFSVAWERALPAVDEASRAVDGHEAAAQAQLRKVMPRYRQALLLTTVEEFAPREAAQILDIPEEEVNALVAEAIAEIERESKTSVLIIEDEALISMQLEDLVNSLGHDICGTATTRTQALAVATESTPGLVLADIQLADGSSGLDAVDDILALAKMPVIFITAYPERLLTGDRTEPTYLITKPFQEKTVRAAISQALFFRSSVPVS